MKGGTKAIVKNSIFLGKPRRMKAINTKLVLVDITLQIDDSIP